MPRLALGFEGGQPLIARDRLKKHPRVGEILPQVRERAAQGVGDLHPASFAPAVVGPLGEEGAGVRSLSAAECLQSCIPLLDPSADPHQFEELRGIPAVAIGRSHPVALAFRHDHGRTGTAAQLRLERAPKPVERHVEGTESPLDIQIRPEPVEQLLAVDRPARAEEGCEQGPRSLTSEGGRRYELVAAMHRKATEADEAERRTLAGADLRMRSGRCPSHARIKVVSELVEHLRAHGSRLAGHVGQLPSHLRRRARQEGDAFGNRFSAARGDECRSHARWPELSLEGASEQAWRL